jgi:hypothetical protein
MLTLELGGVQTRPSGDSDNSQADRLRFLKQLAGFVD